MSGFQHDVALLPLDSYPSAADVKAWWQTTHGSSAEMTLVDERTLWEHELAALPSDILAGLPSTTDWSWAIYPWLRSAVLVPDEPTTYAVLTSRNYPVISRAEQRALRECHILLAGLSTGRAVAQQLVRLGVGSIHLADRDHLAPSNTNRLFGTRLTDMGMPKVVSTARELLEFNPHLSVSTQITFLDGHGLDEHLRARQTAVVVEMIDSLPAKVAIRRVARAQGVPVIMPTDMDWEPMIDLDYPDCAMFGGRLNDDELAAIENSTEEFADKTTIAMRLMGLQRWAPRSFLSGQLARNGLLTYWSQTGPSAAVAGALVSRAVLDIVRGQRPPVSRATLPIRDALQTSDPIDHGEPLYAQLVTANGSFQVPD
jgi:molybdopterin/thiamine biosynthesis adenylyltransferase